MSPHREKPYKRSYPSGKVKWVARYTRPDGSRDTSGTFDLRGPCRAERDDGLCCAQHAIDHAYDADRRGAPDTLGAYFATWPERHPRSERTNDTNRHRIERVLSVKIEGLALKDWPMRDLKRRHALDLVTVMLVDQGRAVTGARNIMSSLSAMAEDAWTDEICDGNPFRGVKIRASDVRVRKQRKKLRVFTFEDLRKLAAAAATAKTGKDPHSPMNKWRPVYAEAMLRLLSDCGLRLGELPAIYRTDLRGDILEIRRTAHEGKIQDGTKTDHGDPEGGRDVPVAPTLLAMLQALPARIDIELPLMFPTATGKLWRERNWYRDVLEPARKATGITATPQEMRHTYVSRLRAAGVDPADLADMTGHTEETATGHYTHALKQSYDNVRGLIG